MTLNTPLLYSVNAFDPSNEHTFEFEYSGAQANSNRAVITDKDTQEVVYNVKQDGLKLNHVLPANTLLAGHSYLIQIQVYDANGNYSNLSEAILFYCFTTPQFYFSNINNGDTISTANIELALTYTQQETETLNEYKYYLYDMTRSLIYTSDSYYTESNMTHIIYGLKNDVVYYVRAMGKTAHGMDVDTGMIAITVKYLSVASNLAFEATNDSNSGCIVLKTNIITVDFEIENENYKIENGIVDLTGNTLTYLIGAEGDFYLPIIATKIPIGNFCWTTDKSILVSIKVIAEKYYAHLSIDYNNVRYNIFKLIDESYLGYVGSDYISTIDGLAIAFQVYRKNNIYDLEVTYV